MIKHNENSKWQSVQDSSLCQQTKASMPSWSHPARYLRFKVPMSAPHWLSKKKKMSAPHQKKIAIFSSMHLKQQSKSHIRWDVFFWILSTKSTSWIGRVFWKGKHVSIQLSILSGGTLIVQLNHLKLITTVSTGDDLEQKRQNNFFHLMWFPTG